MKPEPDKKNFSLLWILGGVAVAAGAALLFNRSKRPLTDAQYIAKEKELLDQIPVFIERLRQALPTQKTERQKETERLLHYYEHKLRVLREALTLFPNDLEGRKSLYAVERAAYELDHPQTE